MPKLVIVGLTVLACAAAADVRGAAAARTLQEKVQVTATRIPQDVLGVPASVTVVSGAELQARGVRDLAGALALVGGISIAPGGDGGPASAVPELMGLREFDAFLLVVDGVPWGGAFNPDLATLDLTDVDRIEVLRGAAPVLYGATSFVGVIHVLHRAPGDTPAEVGIQAGNHDGYRAALTAGLPGGSRFRHSVATSAERRGFSDPRTGFDRVHLLYNGAADVAGGRLTASFDVASVRQEPASPHPRRGVALTPLVPLDANHNPSDAGIDRDRTQLVAGYERSSGRATWTTLLALAHTGQDTVRGFLREDFEPAPGLPNADGYRQEFSEDDFYLDSHWAWVRGSETALVAGVDLLAGRGSASSENFEYAVPLDGSNAPSSEQLPVDERPELEDERMFAGAYAQLLWSPAPRWRIDAGVRLNATSEKQEGEVEQNGVDVRAGDERSDTRPSGSFGASFRAWRGTRGAVWVHGVYTDAFKPAAVDFGPEAGGEILDPETARTFEAGCKGSHADGRWLWQASVYRMDFDNLVLSQSVNGLPALANGGSQRFEGLEVAASWRAADALSVRASLAAHSAKFLDYVAEFGGVATQLAGNTLELSADRLASLGVAWAPERGWRAWLTANHVGERYLDKRNNAPADPFATLSAGVGYRFERLEIRLEGQNLTDARDPVSESELGDAQYYRLPARRLWADLRWRL